MNGRGFNRGSSGNRGGRSDKQQTFRGPKATVRPQMNIPQPLHLSKTSSAETNDPLWRDAFIPEPGSELRPKPEALEFTPSCVGFMAVVDQTYIALTAADNNFGRRVPESLFSYYCAVGLWARLLSIHQANRKQLSFAEMAFVEQVKNLNPQYPAPVAAYINGFGNFKGVDGALYEMSLFTRPNVTTERGICGWWNVDEATHVLYENFVHPSVCAMRILEDMVFVGGANPQWNLPPNVEPPVWGQYMCGVPTINLLGWKPAVELRAEARQVLEGSRLSVNPFTFPSDNAEIVFNVSLMTRVMEFLSHEAIFPAMSLNYTVVGSGGQAAWVEPARGESYVVGSGRVQRNELLIQKSPWNLDGRVSNASATFLLRFCRRVEARTAAEIRANEAAIAAGNNLPVFGNTRNNWSCYSWNDYLNVPDSWIATANVEFEGSPGQLQAWQFWNAQFLHDARVKRVITAFETGS